MMAETRTLRPADARAEVEVEVQDAGTTDPHSILIAADFTCNDRGSRGYFDHVTGAAEPPSGPEVDPNTVTVRRFDEDHGREISWEAAETLFPAATVRLIKEAQDQVGVV